MRRGDVTVEEMTRRGWVKPKGWNLSDCWEYAEFKGYDLDAFLQAIREGAKVKMTREPEDGFVYERKIKDPDWCVYYPRESTERYHIEIINVWYKGKWRKVMSKEVVDGEYKTSSQRYMGD